MSNYTDRIKVVCGRNMCFPVNKDTLEATQCSYYDVTPYYQPEALEIITYAQWCARLERLRQKNDRFSLATNY